VPGVAEERDRAAVAMAFPLSAYSVTLYFSGPHPTSEERLRQLAPASGKRSGLAPFRYAILGFEGGACIDRFIVRSKDGTVLNDGGRMHCQR
jgi:hypothetical protein